MISNPRFTRLINHAVFASALTILAFRAFAADFPVGSYAIDASKPTLSFDDKGHFRVTQGDKLQVAGTFTVKGDEIRLTDREGPWACTKAGEKSGTYHWKYENSMLTFSKSTDACQDRVGSLVAMNWKKQA